MNLSYDTNMKTIILTGMMGSGKSTIGKLLAEKLNAKLIEIDNLIEKFEQTTISEIFKNKGEEYFRNIEQEIIFDNFKSENQIISLGGGTFENAKTRDFLLKNAIVIYLKTSEKIIYERIKNDKSRPLLCDNMTIENIENIIKKREQNYQTATYTIVTDNKNPQDLTDEIIGVI